MFKYFPTNYVWNLSVDLAIEMGARIGEIEEMCAPCKRPPRPRMLLARRPFARPGCAWPTSSADWPKKTKPGVACFRPVRSTGALRAT